MNTRTVILPSSATQFGPWGDAYRKNKNVLLVNYILSAERTRKDMRGARPKKRRGGFSRADLGRSRPGGSIDRNDSYFGRLIEPVTVNPASDFVAVSSGWVLLRVRE